MNKERKRVYDTIELPFKVPDRFKYNQLFHWGNIKNVEGIEDTDVFVEVKLITKDECVPFIGDTTTHTPTIVVRRWRDENDEEYFARMKKDALKKKQEEDKEYNEYLRLKAKYES